MWLSLLGLGIDILGAILLIIGEIKGSAALVNYWGTGEQSENYRQQIGRLVFWKRWPLQLAVRFGAKEHMGADSIEDSFPVTAWGLFLLIVGFLFQALGTIFPSW